MCDSLCVLRIKICSLVDKTLIWLCDSKNMDLVVSAGKDKGKHLKGSLYPVVWK